MEAIIFIGIQATGKTTFYMDRFLKTHIRISMDMLNTRNKEQKFLDTCFLVQQPFVIDNTNPGISDRAGYIEQAKANKYKVIGYYFQSKIEDSFQSNSTRQGKEFIPEIGIEGTHNKLFDFFLTGQTNIFENGICTNIDRQVCGNAFGE